MSDLSDLFAAQDKSARCKAEAENALTRYELAMVEERCAYLISQHEPIASAGIDREKLRLILKYVRHGQLRRLVRELKELPK